MGNRVDCSSRGKVIGQPVKSHRERIGDLLSVGGWSKPYIGSMPCLGIPGNRENRKGCGGSDSCVHKIETGDQNFSKNFGTLRFRPRKNCHVILTSYIQGKI